MKPPPDTSWVEFDYVTDVSSPTWGAWVLAAVLIGACIAGIWIFA